MLDEKTKDYRDRIFYYAGRLRDVRVIGLLLFGTVVVLMSWSGVKVIDTNYGLQKEISELEQQNRIHELGNTNLKLSNQYYETNQYMEITARQNFGLAAPGETVIVIPRDVALAQTIDLPNTEQKKQEETAAKQPVYQRNFQAWMNFLLHRDSKTD